MEIPFFSFGFKSVVYYKHFVKWEKYKGMTNLSKRWSVFNIFKYILLIFSLCLHTYTHTHFFFLTLHRVKTCAEKTQNERMRFQ